MKRYVYRGIAEPPARPNAGGNIIRLGMIAPQFAVAGGGIAAPSVGPVRACPAWGCGAPPTHIITSATGATSTTPQPPPSAPWGGYQTPNPTPMPVSPAPSPTVQVSPTQTAPSNTNPGTTLSSTGQSVSGWSPTTVESIGYAIVDQYGNVQEVTSTGQTGGSLPNFNQSVGGTTSDGSVVWTNQGPPGTSASSSTTGLMNWLNESTLINGFPNWGLVAAGVGAWLLMKGKK